MGADSHDNGGQESKRISALRWEYSHAVLMEDHAEHDPRGLFERWLSEADRAGLREPNAMVVASVSAQGMPSLRTVLLKESSAEGFIFYTNYCSQKGREFDGQPVAAALFFWKELERQVRLSGTIARVARAQTERYFNSRPRPAQIGAWASPQSAEIPSRAVLEQRYQECELRFKETVDIPCPEWWGGYEIRPDVYEFWQGRENRLHDRLQYQRAGEGWRLSRLAP